MVLETNEQTLPTNLESMNQLLSDITKRCKSPFSDSHLRLCIKSKIPLGLTSNQTFVFVDMFNAVLYLVLAGFQM